MLIAALPENEAERLAALHALLILDSPPEQRFDNIVEFAAAEFDVPIAVVTLVAAERQWFKARVGIDVCETGRDVAFCAHAILTPDILVVPDAQLDPRFSGNPHVTGPANVRFYAGAPLILPSGMRLGTLCLVDSRPRTLDAMELSILATLRDLVVRELTTTGEVADA